jgi:hypothetical protein
MQYTCPGCGEQLVTADGLTHSQEEIIAVVNDNSNIPSGFMDTDCQLGTLMLRLQLYFEHRDKEVLIIQEGEAHVVQESPKELEEGSG